MGSDGVEKIPHISKIKYEGMDFPVLITVPGRPPLCLNCHSTGHVRYEWDLQPFRLVRVHWLPGYVPDVCIHNFLSQFCPVASILPERATEGFESGVRRAKVGSDGIEKIPHLSKIEYEGMDFPVLITVPGRPPLCLKCHSTGHVRYECDAKSQVGSWAARVSGARAGGFR